MFSGRTKSGRFAEEVVGVRVLERQTNTPLPEVLREVLGMRRTQSSRARRTCFFPRAKLNIAPDQSGERNLTI